jgi:hypothetical protein
MAAPKTSNLNPSRTVVASEPALIGPTLRALSCSACYRPLALLMPLPLKIAVDSMLGSQPLPALLGVLMPAGVAQSASAVLALTVGLTVAIPLLSALQALATSFLQADGGKADFELPSPAVPISSTDDCRGWMCNQRAGANARTSVAGPHSEANVAEHAVARVWTVVRPCWSNLDLAADAVSGRPRTWIR